ncbi:MAG: prepilin-type N-terminal cleavage/methylation domain-containing protein [Fimbriimonadales bacterium]|nr:prepilin-type N-terminal cleavage/methylation domain-containing protein [Fimbriimonadales bacterium]
MELTYRLGEDVCLICIHLAIVPEKNKLFYGKILLGDEVRLRVRAFTLVELLIVIIIVSVLATIAIPKVNDSWKRSSESAMKASLKAYRGAADQFYADCGCYPTMATLIDSQTAPSQCYDDNATTISLPAGRWKGPYLSKRVVSTYFNLHPDYRSISLSAYMLTIGGGRPVYKVQLTPTTLVSLNGTTIGTW